MTDPTAAIGAALVAHIRAIVAHDDDLNRRIAHRIAATRAQGYRIVKGGQYGDFDLHGNAPFQVLDEETGETLWAAHTTGTAYEAEWDRHPEWWALEQIQDPIYVTDDPAAPEQPASLPPGILTDADPDKLREWLTTFDTPAPKP